MRVAELTPSDWETFEDRIVTTNVFHDIRWLAIVRECLGGALNLYLCEAPCGSWLAPCYSGAGWSRLGFRIGGVGYGGPAPIAPDWDQQDSLGDCLRAASAISRHRQEPLAGGTAFPHARWRDYLGSTSTRYSFDWTCILEFQETIERSLFENIAGVKRTAIRKAQRSGVEVRELKGFAEVHAAHELIERTQKRVGSEYTTPRILLDRLLSGELPGAAAFGALYQGKFVSTVVTLRRKREAFLLFHGWDREFGRTNANELLYWEAIQFLARQGVGKLDLGRSHSPSLLGSKMGWGAAKVPVLRFGTAEWEKDDSSRCILQR